MTRFFLSLLLALCVACGSHTNTPSGVTIDDLREAAEDAPNDPDAWRELATAELFMEGGDPARARPAIEHALRLANGDERVMYLAAFERDLHGDLDGALDRYLQTLTLAKRSERNVAPFIAEAAVTAIEDLDDSAHGYATKVREGLEPLVRDPGHLGIAARHTASEILIDLAFRRDAPDEADRLAREQGCLREARVAGPFGPFELLGFDGPMTEAERPLTERGALADSYDLGPGRGTNPTRAIAPRGCAMHLGNGPLIAGGVTYVESFVELPHDGEYVLRLETPNASEFYVDGERVSRIDMRREPVGRVSYVPVRLSAGRHEVTAKIVTRHPNPVLLASIASADGTLAGGQPITFEPGLPQGEGLFDSHIRTMVAIGRGDIVGAREELRRVNAAEGPGAQRTLAGIVALSDPFVPGDKRRDNARRLMRAAKNADPRAWTPRYQLAQLDAADGRTIEAIASLREAARDFPGVLTIRLTLIDLLVGRGFEAEADRVIASAREAMPDACRPIRAALESALRRDRTQDADALITELLRCDARSPARHQALVRERNWEAARTELTRLARLEPQPNESGVLYASLELDRGAGDMRELDRHLTKLRDLAPRNHAIPLAQADRLAAEGNADRARELLQRAITEDPSSMAALHRLGTAIGRSLPLAEHRLDGARILREFEASGRTYDQPQVLVLDYTVVLVYPDGSSLELTHNIFRVQSQEAVDQQGEFSPPPGAEILTLHTIKAADGRRIEPDAIAGKETISLPNLAPGDYVEFEYIRANGPPAAYPSGWLGDRFYFQSFEVPFDRSELTVILPRDMEAVIEPRGAAPELEERTSGDNRVLHFIVRESRPLVPEPMSVASREFIPSINIGVRANWDGFVQGLRDVLADRDVRDPASRRLVQRILRGSGQANDLQRAQRIYAWVLENIEEDGDAFGLAPGMVSARQGSRARVMHYLLGLADIPSELVVARTITADATEARLPDDETYTALLLAVGRGANRVFLSTNERGAPFGYVPPFVRGQRALRLVAAHGEVPEGDAYVEIPRADDTVDRRVIDVDIELDDDGSAHVAVRESFFGSGAVSWRGELEGVAPARLEQMFDEQYVARLVPGAAMTDLEIEGREDRSAPLVLAYEFDVPQLGRRIGNRLLVPTLYPSQLAPSLAALAERRTAQLIAAPIVIEAKARVTGPTRLDTLPEVELEGPAGASFRMRTSRAEDALIIERTVHIPQQRVEPDRYPELARFCRAVDEAEQRELAVPVGN